MKTTVVNKYKENFDVYIGRGTLFGNPYEIGKDGNRLEVIQKYKKWFIEKLKDFEFKKQVLNLKGKKLGCFCKPKLCHGDIIVGYLNRSSKFSNYKVKNIDLYQHQIETIKFYLQYKRCFILDDMGTGKTMAMLAATDFLKLNEKINRVLIISPLSVVMSTWTNHIMKYFPHRKFAILHGTKEKRIKELNSNATYYVINTDGIKIIEKEIISKRFDVLIVDESTYFSVHNTKRTKCLWRISKTIPSVVCMTGDPIPDDTIQSFAQAKIVNPDTAPRYFTKFRDLIKIKLDMYNYIDRPEAIKIAKKILTPSIRHVLEECIDIPPVTYEYRDIQLTKEQEKHYKSMEKEYVAEIDQGVITAANAAVKALKLMQISAGIIINETSQAITIDHKYRLKELDHIYKQLPKKKLVVFATFTASVNALVDHFKGKAKKIDGSVNLKKRSAIIDDFQDGDLEILICQPAAVSHGIDLFASNIIIWFGPCYSNKHYAQCNRRIRRSGQTRPQLIIKFQSTRVERRIYVALEKKQKVSHALLNLV